MSQLSVYDFLSFFLPGFIAIELLRFVRSVFSFSIPFITIHFSEVEKGTLLLVASVFSGLLIHRLSFWAVKFTWYQSLVYQSVGYIALHSKDIMQIQSGLDHYCREVMQKPFFISKGIVAPYFFDYAYYFLEANDKITAAKGFQSFYFLMRNLFTLSVLAIIGLCLLQAVHFISKGHVSSNIFFVIAVLILSLPLIISAARFCRLKMTERIFWTFYLIKKEAIKKP